ENGLWKAKLPEVKAGKWDFRMLIVNNRFANRARYPETEFLLHNSEFDVSWQSTYEGGFVRQPTHEELTMLDYNPKDIPEDFVPENAEITVFHMWDESLVGVKSINREKNQITFTNAPGFPPGAFSKEHSIEKRYVIWNTKEGLKNPGQWYLDRKNGELVYWPLEGELMESLEVIAPVLENLIIAEGSNEQPVESITLKNLTLSATNAPLKSGAFGAKLFDGAISFRKVNNSQLDNLNIKNVGAHCIKADGNHLQIKNCELNNAGAGAIRYVGSETLIRNNHIHNIGKTFPSAIALYVGATDPNVPEEWEPGLSYKNCTIEHNELHHVPYAAICAGGKNIKIQKNLIYEAMQDLYDGAGIYITFCNNALIKNNFIRDIKDSPGAGTSAYYLDEKSIDCIVEENMEINVPRASHNHISKNNIFRNNFFIMKEKGWFTIERSENYTFENNVVVTGEGFDMWDLVFCPNLRNNILFSGNGGLGTKDLKRYEILKEYELELKDGNRNEDPLLLNYKDGKVIVAENSPIHEMGIKPIDVSDAGLLNS
ncbi:MAG: right-handed parallel beta-helix repeat-containing protein, partial [Draconibacterium sp.]|nr:right-handed parallel beta-helix repeat-containing protein [Draconibacterium sp.]